MAGPASPPPLPTSPQPREAVRGGRDPAAGRGLGPELASGRRAGDGPLSQPSPAVGSEGPASPGRGSSHGARPRTQMALCQAGPIRPQPRAQSPSVHGGLPLTRAWPRPAPSAPADTRPRPSPVVWPPGRRTEGGRGTALAGSRGKVSTRRCPHRLPSPRSTHKAHGNRLDVSCPEGLPGPIPLLVAQGPSSVQSGDGPGPEPRC